jgi:arsenite methyltransferase
MSSRPDYGIDAPGVIRNLILSGVAIAVITLIWHTVRIGPVTLALYPGCLYTAASLITPGILMLVYAKFGKFRHRDRILGYVPWQGNEQVLDVGSGRGLLLAGAAKHLTTGYAIGIDVWNAEDLSGNNEQNLLRNLDIEGVRSMAEVQNQDAQKVNFPDATFDAIVSNLCLQNIYKKDGRAQACREIARVLKTTGVIVISDFRHMSEYRDNFEALGLQVEYKPLNWDTFPQLRILLARKTESASSRYTGTVNVLKDLMLLALVLWIGGIVFFGAVVAPAVFTILPTHDLAGKVVTRTLANLHLIGIICGVVFLVCSMIVAYVTKGSAQPFAPRHIAVVVMIALTFFAQDVVARKMNHIKDQIGVIDNVPLIDPQRVEFNRLHVWSTRLEGCILVLGLGVLFGTARRLS